MGQTGHTEYVHLIDTVSNFEDKYYGDWYHEPWVSLTLEDRKVYYNKHFKGYLRFDVLTGGQIKWTSSDTAITRTIEYSKNGGKWIEITSTTGGTAIDVSAGDTVFFRGENQQYAEVIDPEHRDGYGKKDPYESNNVRTVSFNKTTCDFRVSGNIMTLIKKQRNKALKLRRLTGDCNFYGLLKVSGTRLKSIDGLTLPAIHLTDACYAYMFDGAGIANAPVLPAREMTESCYRAMFNECPSLTTMPELQNTEVKPSCFRRMFYHTGISSVPADYLKTTTLAYACYSSMFYNCYNLASAPDLPATVLADNCYYGMFHGCVKLTEAPELPATTLAEQCYHEMFNGCTGLTAAPELPAPVLAPECYETMFYGCSNLSYIKCLAMDISPCACTRNWVVNVAPAGTFVKPASMTDWAIDSVHGIPIGWTPRDDGAIEVSPDFIETDLDGGAYQLDINATGDWTAVTGDSWIQLSQTTGTSAVTSVTVTVPQDTDGRIGTVTFATAYETVTVTVKQTSPLEEALTFEALTDGKIYWRKSADTATTRPVEYSKNGGAWTEIIPVTGDTSYVEVVTGDIVLFRGNNAAYSNGSWFNSFDPGTAHTGDTAQVKVYGNVMSLISKDNFRNLDAFTADYALKNLFIRNNIVDASGLLLPATGLTTGCYEVMFKDNSLLVTPPVLGDAAVVPERAFYAFFQNCVSLTTAPELPATSLGDFCYNIMFKGCSSLTAAPELPATSLGEKCYGYMFQDCVSLTTAEDLPLGAVMSNECCIGMFQNCVALTEAPALPATSLGTRCYSNMFALCSGLITPPELPAVILTTECYLNMFSGCTSLATAPELPATALTEACYQSMFVGCQSLEKAPSLPAPTLVSNCYNSMFGGCASLNEVKCLATNISAGACTYNWLNNVSATGTFTKAAGMADWRTDSADGIPVGWDVEDAS